MSDVNSNSPSVPEGEVAGDLGISAVVAVLTDLLFETRIRSTAEAMKVPFFSARTYASRSRSLPLRF